MKNKNPGYFLDLVFRRAFPQKRLPSQRAARLLRQSQVKFSMVLLHSDPFPGSGMQKFSGLVAWYSISQSSRCGPPFRSTFGRHTGLGSHAGSAVRTVQERYPGGVEKPTDSGNNTLDTPWPSPAPARILDVYCQGFPIAISSTIEKTWNRGSSYRASLVKSADRRRFICVGTERGSGFPPENCFLSMG